LFVKKTFESIIEFDQKASNLKVAVVLDMETFPVVEDFKSLFNAHLSNLKLEVVNSEQLNSNSIVSLLVKLQKRDKIYFFHPLNSLLTTENIVNVASVVKDLSLNIFEIVNYKNITVEKLEAKKQYAITKHNENQETLKLRENYKKQDKSWKRSNDIIKNYSSNEKAALNVQSSNELE